MGADSPTDLYNVACGYAVLKQPEKALDWLDKAVAAGFRNRRLIETDDDLESLRETPRFQKIVSGLPA
jgi:hypothetical protein